MAERGQVMRRLSKVLSQYFERVSHHPSGVISVQQKGHKALVFPGKKLKLRIINEEGLVVREKTARLWRISWELFRWKENIS